MATWGPTRVTTRCVGIGRILPLNVISDTGRILASGRKLTYAPVRDRPDGGRAPAGAAPAQPPRPRPARRLADERQQGPRLRRRAAGGAGAAADHDPRPSRRRPGLRGALLRV